MFLVGIVLWNDIKNNKIGVMAYFCCVFIFISFGLGVMCGEKTKIKNNNEMIK